MEAKQNISKEQDRADGNRAVTRRTVFDGVELTYVCPACGKEYIEHSRSRLRSYGSSCNSCYLTALYGG